MKLKIQVWKIGLLLIFLGIVQKILSTFGYILSIQGFMDMSFISLFFGSGLILIYVDIMILSTKGLKILFTIIFAFFMFLFSDGITISKHEFLISDEHQIVVQISKGPLGFNLMTHENELTKTITFYEKNGLIFSREIGSYYFKDDDPYHYVIENNQLIIFRGSDSNFSIYEIDLS